MLDKSIPEIIENLFRNEEFKNNLVKLVVETLEKGSKNPSAIFASISRPTSKVSDKFFVRDGILNLVYFSKTAKEEKRLPVYKEEYIKGIELIHLGVTPTESQLIKINQHQITKAKNESLCDDNKIRYIKRFLVSKEILKKKGKLVYLIGEKETFKERCLSAWKKLEE